MKLLLPAAAVLAIVAVVLATRPYPGCTAYTRANTPLVAHAGGGLPDRTYSNSLEAIDLAVSYGHTIIELDFIERDGRMLIGHDERRISDLTIAGLMAWLGRHPKVSIITDIKTDNLSGLRLLKQAARENQARFIPQIYQPQQYAPVAMLGYSRIIFADRIGESRGWFPWVNRVKLWAVTIPKEKAHLAGPIKHPVFLYTVNEPRQDYGLYTDCLIPG